MLSNYGAGYHRYATGRAGAAARPRNASCLEMFAPMCYQDDQGMKDGGTFSSYQRMKTYASNAQMNGYCSGVTGGDDRLAADDSEHKRINEFTEEEWDALIAKTDTQIDEMRENVRAESEQKTDAVSFTKVTGRNRWDDPNTKQTEYSGYNGYTFYTEEGIFYMKSGCNTRDREYSDTVEWSIRFGSEDDYDRVMEWLGALLDRARGGLMEELRGMRQTTPEHSA